MSATLLVDNLKFYASFTYTLVTTFPRAFLSFLFYTAVHHLLGVDPAPKRAFDQALKGDRNRGAKPCPYARALGSHEYVAPAPGTRGPCPALNVMANHGYLPRNGQNISGFDLTRALMECYNLSWPLAAFLSWGGVIMLGQVGLLSLPDLARHNRIEHDASITHPNAQKDALYAPTHQDAGLQTLFAQDARESGVYSKTEIARARIRREAEPRTRVTAVQQEVARGEVALVLQIFGGAEYAVPASELHTWWFEERLPEGWRPTRQTTLLGTVHWSTQIRNEMSRMRDAMAKAGVGVGVGAGADAESISSTSTSMTLVEEEEEEEEEEASTWMVSGARQTTAAEAAKKALAAKKKRSLPPHAP